MLELYSKTLTQKEKGWGRLEITWWVRVHAAEIEGLNLIPRMLMVEGKN